MTENIFADEWRDCLRAHYMHVIHIRDRVTEPSLTVVMYKAGFDDSELAELRVRATMHIDDVSDDFVPDLDALKHSEEVAEEAPKIVVVPEMPSAPQDEPEIEAELFEISLEHEPNVDDESVGEDEAAEAEPEADDPEAPQQLSFF